MTTDWSDIGAVSILKERIRELEAEIREWAKEAAAKLDRITQLEAERDEWRQAAKVEAGLRREFSAKRDAIRAKTIEECAKICEPIEGEHFPPSWDATVIERHHATRRWCAAAIRALAQTDEASAPGSGA